MYDLRAYATVARESRMIVIYFKRGDTFLLSCAYTVDGVPASLPLNVRAQVRDRAGSLIAELDVLRVDEAQGKYTLGFADTSTWPVDVLQSDIQYTDGSGNVASTDTFLVNLQRDETHD